MKSISQLIFAVFAFSLSFQVMSTQLLDDVESALQNSGNTRALGDFAEVEPLPVSQWPEKLRKGVYAQLWQRNSGLDEGAPIGHPPIHNPDLRPRYWGAIDGSYVIQEGQVLNYLVIYKVRLLDGFTEDEFYEYYLMSADGELLKTGQF